MEPGQRVMLTSGIPAVVVRQLWPELNYPKWLVTYKERISTKYGVLDRDFLRLAHITQIEEV